METQRRLLERAQQGDPAALACVTSRCLRREGVAVRVSLEGEGLRILLESPQIPDQEVVLQRLRDNFARLDVSLKRVQVCAKQVGKEELAWEVTLTLETDASNDATDATDATDRSASFLVQSKPSLKASARSRRSKFNGMLPIAALIALNLLLGFRSMLKLKLDSQSYVDQTVPQVVAGWNIETLINQASPELLQATSRSQLQQTFNQFSHDLGKLQHYQQAKCDVNASLAPSRSTMSQCHTTLRFEKASATLEIQLVWHEDQWQIYRFDLYPGRSPSS